MFLSRIKLKSNRFLLLFFVGFLLSSCAQNKLSDTAQSLPSSLETQVKSLAGEWSFKIDPYNEGQEQKWWKKTLDAKQWDQITVPGVWDVYDQYHDYTGTAWYRYEFSTDEYSDREKVQLVFDSVYHDSEVWLNDVYLGANSLGFMAFKFDVTKHLNKDAANTLVVKVNNRVKRGAVWNWGGIRFPVYLTVLPHTNIEHAHVTATPNLETGQANIVVKTKINHNNIDLKNAQVKINILRKGRKVYSNTVSELKLSADNEVNFIDTFTLNKDDVDLWHFNDPNLYHVEAILLLNNKPHHQLTDRFGIRKVSLKDNGLYLNGERIRLNGFNMVPEDRFDGNALPITRIKEDVDLLKTLNGNFARLSGPALPKNYLDYLDEVGFLLIEEVGLWGKDKLVDPDHPLPKEWLKRLINDHHNHPSIIGWSVGNEIGDLQKNPKALEYVSGAIEHSKILDPSRLAVYISYSADYQKDDPTQFSDIVMFNKYDDHEERLKVVHDFHPNKAIFFSEIGTKLDGVDPNESTLEPQKLWNSLKKYPYLIGTSHFAFNDYRSDWKDEKATWTTDLSENRAWGVLTSYRQKKRSFEKLRNFNAPIESLEIDELGKGKYTLSITPKSKNTFPAFILRNYQVVWLAKNISGEVIDTGVVNLPTVTPGDKKLSYAIATTTDFAQLNVSLLDPLGYIVKQDSLFKQLPKSPKIKAVFPSLDTVRVTFDRLDIAQEYQLVATNKDGKEFIGKATINDFAEVTGLEPHQTYKLNLTAINTSGTSQPTTESVNVITTSEELPPIVWSVFGKQDAFHIGFSVGRNDFKYEIQYGLKSGNYTKRILIDTHGATRIPAIEPGKKHYFKFRRLITGSIDSNWTQEYDVSLNGSQGIEAPQDTVAITTSNGIILNLTPKAGAVGYRLKWMNNGVVSTVDTNLAYSPFITVNEPSVIGVQKLEIATIDSLQQTGTYQPVKIWNKQ